MLSQRQLFDGRPSVFAAATRRLPQCSGPVRGEPDTVLHTRAPVCIASGEDFYWGSTTGADGGKVFPLCDDTAAKKKPLYAFFTFCERTGEDKAGCQQSVPVPRVHAPAANVDICMYFAFRQQRQKINNLKEYCIKKHIVSFICRAACKEINKLQVTDKPLSVFFFLLRRQRHVFYVNGSCARVPVNISAKINRTRMLLHPTSSHETFEAVDAATRLRSDTAGAWFFPAGRQARATPRPSSQELFVFPTSAVCCRAAALLPSIWTFYGDVIYVALWHVNDAREPCLASIFMNNCVRGMAGGGAATRPPKVSRARSLGSGAAEACGSHACRHWPTCSSRLVAFPEKINGERTKKHQAGMFDGQLSNFIPAYSPLAYRQCLMTSTVAIYLFIL